MLYYILFISIFTIFPILNGSAQQYGHRRFGSHPTLHSSRYTPKLTYFPSTLTSVQKPQKSTYKNRFTKKESETKFSSNELDTLEKYGQADDYQLFVEKPQTSSTKKLFSKTWSDRSIRKFDVAINATTPRNDINVTVRRNRNTPFFGKDPQPRIGTPMLRGKRIPRWPIHRAIEFGNFVNNGEYEDALSLAQEHLPSYPPAVLLTRISDSNLLSCNIEDQINATLPKNIDRGAFANCISYAISSQETISERQNNYLQQLNTISQK